MIRLEINASSADELVNEVSSLAALIRGGRVPTSNEGATSIEEEKAAHGATWAAVTEPDNTEDDGDDTGDGRTFKRKSYWYHPESDCAFIVEAGEPIPTDGLSEKITGEKYKEICERQTQEAAKATLQSEPAPEQSATEPEKAPDPEPQAAPEPAKAAETSGGAGDVTTIDDLRQYTIRHYLNEFFDAQTDRADAFAELLRELKIGKLKDLDESKIGEAKALVDSKIAEKSK